MHPEGAGEAERRRMPLPGQEGPARSAQKQAGVGVVKGQKVVSRYRKELRDSRKAPSEPAMAVLDLRNRLDE